MAQRRQKASPKPRSRWPQQTVESLRRRLTREREQRREALEREREALEQQTATADILGVISRSPSDIEPVLQAVAERAALLCEATDVHIRLAQGELMPPVVQLGSIPLAEETKVQRITRESVPGRAILECRTIHIHDIQQPEVRSEYPESLFYRHPDPGFRTILVVPLVRGAAAIGSITVRRAQMRPFSEQQIKLLQIFAEQAVIAIENVRLFNETKEALEQQTAISEVLRVISGSPADVDPVLRAVAERAAKICDALDARIFLREGDRMRHVAGFGEIPLGIDLGATRPLARGWVAGRAVLEGKAIHIADLLAVPRDEYPETHQLRDVVGHRTILAVPLMRERQALGAITLRRMEVRPFTEKQIALLKTFADQAAIAIENVRLLNETKEALEQQTATAGILRVISSSPTDIQPVLDAVATTAARLCGASDAVIRLVDGGVLQLAAKYGAILADSKARPIDRGSVMGRAVLERRTIHIYDVLDDAGLTFTREMARRHGFRTVLSTPLLREGQPIGAISIRRPEARLFSDSEVRLLKTFADQAVIAIENVRLFKELQATNANLRETLEHQTATSDILKVISSSPTELQPVFDTIVRSAALLGNAAVGFLISYDGTTMRLAAQYNVDPQQQAIYRPAFPRPAARDTMTGRSIVDCTVINLPDIQGSDFGEGPKERARRAGYRSALIVPLLRGGVPIGSLNIQRRETGTFPDSYVALVKTFADQAVIAIENARLFNETKEALERQTATADILKVIAASPADVQPVFDAIIRSASALSGGCSVNVSRLVGDQLHLAAYTPVSPEADELLRSLYPIPATVVRPLSEAVRRKAPFFVSDFENDPGISQRSRDVMRARGFRSTLYVPIMRGDVVHGVMHVSKVEPGPFEQKWIDLLQTFADQAVIAIENVRLFNETKEALEQQKASAEVLGAISSSIADTQPVFEKILESCGSLFVGHDSGIGLVGDDNLVHLAAHLGPQAEELRKVFPVPLTRESGTGSAILERAVKHYPDVFGNVDVPSYVRRSAEKVGFKSVVFAPMFWEGRGIGAIWVGRNFAAPFTDKQIALLETFADQAAIAIQNARLFREIQEKSAQLEVASHHKSQFLASMSHELRTPLNAILGFNEMLLDQVYGELSEDVKAPLENMQASGKHLLRLINNVLDLAKIEAGRMELALSDYSVQDTVESVRSTLRPLAESKGLELLATVPQDLPLAYGDPGRITQCLMNLAGNSLKFTQAGKVEIAVALNDGTLVYRVADTGIGIPPDKIGSLFTEFKQTDATIASEYGGTGLGLSITKKFIEMHGGRIWVESEPGTGSTFTFEVPLRAGERKAA